ncbi:Carboxypeptidase [Quillaja saponaria]|uniref:Carboxypeptidase n=1 Tax=Quillaja saponaria TaxID=32244 RepID=A0AAD7Q7Y7_QUISA|nr:Carboxypeptidase [Quillaja saponaria]
MNFNFKGLAIGNPLLDFDIDFNSKAEFFCSHGLISDSTCESFNKIGNPSQIRRQTVSGTLTDVCAGANKQVFSELSSYVDTYDITLSICLASVLQQAAVLHQLVRFIHILEGKKS